MAFSNYSLVSIVLLGCSLGEILFAANEPSMEVRFAAWKYHLIGQEEYYRDLVQAFERAHPGERVVVELNEWTAAHDRIRDWISTRQGPDLTIIPDVWLAEFAPFLERYPAQLPAGFMDEFDHAMLERSRYEGEIRGLVWAASTKALFYRTDLFRQAQLSPPRTWDDLLGRAKKLNRPPQMYGLALPGAPELDTADNFYFFLWSNGGKIFDENGKVALDRPEALEALTFYRDLVLKYHVTEPDALKCNRPCAEAVFAEGKAAMVETGPWAIATFRSTRPSVPFSVVPLPKRKEQITQLVTDHLVLLKSSKHKDAALEFIKFAYQPSWRLRWARLGMVPERMDVGASDYFRSDPAWRVFTSVLDQARWLPLVRWEPMDRAIRNSLVEVLSGRVQPERALRDLAVQLSALAAQ
jgi:multiple sugar transport system substrate-binding protein